MQARDGETSGISQVYLRHISGNSDFNFFQSFEFGKNSLYSNSFLSIIELSAVFVFMEETDAISRYQSLSVHVGNSCHLRAYGRGSLT